MKYQASTTNEHHIFPGVDRYVIGGYGNLANAMANKLLTLAPNHFSILLNHQVTHITTNKSNNTVTIEGVNHGKRFLTISNGRP